MERLDEFPIVLAYMVAEDTHTHTHIHTHPRARAYIQTLSPSKRPFFLNKLPGRLIGHSRHISKTIYGASILKKF